VTLSENTSSHRGRASFVVVVLLAFADAGYSPTAWARSALWLFSMSILALLGVAAFAFVGLVDNSVMAASTTAYETLDLARPQAQAHKAAGWMRRSSLPWQRLAEVQLYAGEMSAVRVSLRKAIAKDRDSWKLSLSSKLASSSRRPSHA
jgi:hypothetical protein